MEEASPESRENPAGSSRTNWHNNLTPEAPNSSPVGRGCSAQCSLISVMTSWHPHSPLEKPWGSSSSFWEKNKQLSCQGTFRKATQHNDNRVQTPRTDSPSSAISLPVAHGLSIPPTLETKCWPKAPQAQGLPSHQAQLPPRHAEQGAGTCRFQRERLSQRQGLERSCPLL